MGFMGMGDVVSSDAASDFVYSIGSEIAKRMTAELKAKHTKWNTPGEVNVALAFEALIIPGKEFLYNENLQAVARKTIAIVKRRRGLEKRAKHNEFIADYERMISAMTKFLKDGRF